MDTFQHAPHTAPASSNEFWRRVQQRAGPHHEASQDFACEALPQRRSLPPGDVSVSHP